MRTMQRTKNEKGKDGKASFTVTPFINIYWMLAVSVPNRRDSGWIQCNKKVGKRAKGWGHEKQRFRAEKRPAEAPCEILAGPAFLWECLCGVVVCGREQSTRSLMLEGSAENLTLWPGFQSQRAKLMFSTDSDHEMSSRNGGRAAFVKKKPE